MYTFGSKTKSVVTLEESYLLAVSAISAEAALPKGTIVKINVDGTVSAVTATTDVPYGMLTVGATDIGDRVTVNTQFAAIVNGVADGAVTTADHVACSGIEATGTKPAKYKTGVAADYVIGIALSSAADTEEVRVGILRMPYLKA